MNTFIEDCKKVGIKPAKIEFYTSQDVYDFIDEKAKENEMDIDEFMRTFVDIFIEEMDTE